MSRSNNSKERINPSKLGFTNWGDIPPGWRGASPEQALNSAEAVLTKYPRIAAQTDHRFEVAKRVVRKYGTSRQKQKLLTRF